jgi:tetratricopeptide (TPR) repeat protein
MKRIIIALLITLSVAGIVVGQMKEPKTAKEFFDRGSAFYDKNNLDKALADFNRAIKLDPKFADAYETRAFEYEDKKEPDRAIADYTMVIHLKPSYWGAYSERGDVYMQTGYYDKAIVDYTRVLVLQPSNYIAYYTRAQAYTQKNNFEEAIADWTKCISLSSTASNPYSERGCVYYKKGDYNNAITDGTKAIELSKGIINRGVHSPYDTRACAELKQGKTGDALIQQNFAGIATPGVPACAGAAVWMEMQANKFLGKGDPVKYETMLKFITDKVRVTRAQIVRYAKDDIAAKVDALNKHNVPAKDVQTIKDTITNFYVNPINATMYALATLNPKLHSGNASVLCGDATGTILSDELFDVYNNPEKVSQLAPL